MHDRLRLLEALTRAQRLFVEEAEPRALFGRLLEVFLEFTGSEHGFLAEALRDPEGGCSLRLLASTALPWAETSRRLVEAGLAASLEDLCDAPAPPPGAPAPLRTFLALPLEREGERLGVVGLADRPEGYPPDTAQLIEPLLQAGVSLLLGERGRRAARARVEERDSMLQAVLDTLLDGLITIDAQGTILAVNPATERIFGYPREELVGRDVATLAAEPHRSRHADYMGRYLQTGIPHVIGHPRTVQGERKDGTVFPVSLGVGEYRGPSGRYFVGTVRDLTEARRTESRLRRTEERFQAVLDAASEVSIIATDPHGIITFFNRGAERMLGYRAEEVVGSATPLLLHTPEEVAARGRELTEELGQPVSGFEIFVERARAGQAEKREWTYVRKDGSRLTVELVVTAVTGEGAGETAFLGVATDVTERNEVERLKDEFVSMVSHELRTPLTSIRGSLGLVASGAMGQVPARAQRMLDIAVHNTDRLVRLINDILDIERMRSGRTPMERRGCDLADLMGQAAEVMAPIAQKAGVQLQVTPLAAQILADPDRLVQVLTNLLSNAVKFSPPGGRVHLSAEAIRSEIRIRVADEGRGIPPELLEDVFERFHQVDASDARDRQGSGLGLPICRTIVEQHGGCIWAESRLGLGSTFFVVLPQPQPVKEARPPGVLLACDPGEQGQGLEEALTEQGYRVSAAASGDQALEVLRTEPTDVVLLDMATPGLDTAALLERLTDGPLGDPVPLVLFSSRADEPSSEPPVLPLLDSQGMAAAVFKALTRGVEGPRVLVVEDDEDLLSILTTALEAQGIRCHAARTGREAIAMIPEVEPHLVVLDLVLPQGDGYSVAEWVRRQPRHRGIPLVVYSASDLNPGARQRLLDGATHIYTKGRIAPQEFTDRVLDLLGQLSGPDRSRR